VTSTKPWWAADGSAPNVHAPPCLLRRCIGAHVRACGRTEVLQLSPSGWLLANRPHPEPGAPGREAWAAQVVMGWLRPCCPCGSCGAAGAALAGRLPPQPRSLGRAGAALQACLVAGRGCAPVPDRRAVWPTGRQLQPPRPCCAVARAQPPFLHCRAPAPRAACGARREGLARRMLCARSTATAHGAIRVSEGSCKCALQGAICRHMLSRQQRWCACRLQGAACCLAGFSVQLAA